MGMLLAGWNCHHGNTRGCHWWQVARSRSPKRRCVGRAALANRESGRTLTLTFRENATSGGQRDSTCQRQRQRSQRACPCSVPILPTPCDRTEA